MASQIGKPIPLDMAMAHAVNRASAGGDGSPGFNTGLSGLDAIVGPLVGGQFIVIASPSGLGKSSFALGLMARAAGQTDQYAVLVSPATAAIDVATRFLAARVDLNVRRLAAPSCLDSAEHVALDQARSRHIELPLLIDDNPRRTLASVAATARRLGNAGVLAALAIDDLGLIAAQATATATRSDQLARAGRAMKTVAREVESPIFATVPDVDTEALMEAADQVWSIEPVGGEAIDACEVQIVVKKNRTGPVGLHSARFVKSRGVFLNSKL